jgi:uncharacterized membrane protein
VETASQRKPWLDWQRGLSVLFMVEVHVLDAWRSPGLAGGHLPDALRFGGGLAAPGFLYLAGLSLVLADRAAERRGTAPGVRRARMVWRAGRLLGVAVGLRCLEVLAAALAGGAVPWPELVRVDILHVIALSLAAAAWIATGRGRRGPLLAAAAAIAVVAVSPALDRTLSALAFPGAASPGSAGALARAADLAAAVIAGRPPRATFCLFNWSAFLLTGAALGPLAHGPPRPRAWLALAAGLVGLGLLGTAGWAPGWWAGDYWHTSPAWFSARLGLWVALTGLAQLVPAAAERGLRPLALLGRHSLLAYVVSVELTYGGIAAPLRGRLGTVGVFAGIAGMAAVTWLCAAGWERWRRGSRPDAPRAPAR